MKIRNGFVSNSSSSSFIIVLDKPIEDYSYTEFLEDYELKDDMYASKLFKDLLRNKDFIEEYLEDDENICADVCCSDLIPYEVTREIEKKMEEYGKKLINDWAEKNFDIVDGKRCKYLLSYADGDGEPYSTMEHHFVPEFRGTKEVISHH